MAKKQRIRDPIHNLIEFDDTAFDRACWAVLNTAPMQRLRRIKQLGFSEFTYPGATHTRLAHSIGVFHTARRLAGTVKAQLEKEDRFDTDEARLAVAAALVHDVGHGPFSHAFDDALKKLGKAKRHELRARQILERPEFSKAFEDFPTFPQRISELIEARFPKDIYASVVSSQFDADRLDYMRRDRLMTGTQQSGIDFDWLLANLRVHQVPIQLDNDRIGKTEALVIDEKSIIAAEGYIFSLLYLYINVYYHKTTRGLEKLFSALIELMARRIDAGDRAVLNLASNHPLVLFLENPDSIELFLSLDDAVVQGSLGLLADSKDASVAELASRIRDRKVYKCIDVSKMMSAKFGLPRGEGDARDTAARSKEVAARVARVGELVIERGLLAQNADGLSTILEDTAPRSPYKKDSQSPLFPIYVIGSDGNLHDLADMSPSVDALSDYVAYRLYARTDSDAKAIEAIIEEASK